MFKWLRRKDDAYPLPTRITLEGDTVHVLAGDTELESFRWPDLISVHAWKQDCWSFDRIWIGFQPRGMNDLVCVHDEVEGFDLLIAEMQSRCPGYLQTWRDSVWSPAFAENHTLIWERPTGE